MCVPEERGLRRAGCGVTLSGVCACRLHLLRKRVGVCPGGECSTKEGRYETNSAK